MLFHGSVTQWKEAPSRSGIQDIGKKNTDEDTLTKTSVPAYGDQGSWLLEEEIEHREMNV